ncbi:MAG: FtsX-like permease family protein [Oscillospiraceae bacterium]|nr:FtsX-like permease family protein [Candidatus Ruminococcus equi]
MSKALLKNTLREIKNTKARFISIMMIIALGVGFFVGVKCTNPSMVNMAENYYSESNLMDFRLVSSVGFDKDDVEAVKNLDGVSDVMPSYYADVSINTGASSSVVRLMGVPYDYKDSETINKLVLISGRFPEREGEILLEGNTTPSNSPKELGEKIVIEEKIGDTYAKDSIKRLEFTVVGFVQSPMYISFGRGTTNVGNGKIASYAFIPNEDFVSERYTEVYVRLQKSKDSLSPFSDEYKDLKKEFEEKIEDISDKRLDVFVEENINSAQRELDENKEKFESEKEKAQKELDDAKEELENGENEYNTQIADAQKLIQDGEEKIRQGEIEYQNGKEQYENARAEFEKEFAAYKEKLDSNRKAFEEAKAKFENEQKPALLAGIEELENGIYSLGFGTLQGIEYSIPDGFEEVKEYIRQKESEISVENSLSILLDVKDFLHTDFGDTFDATIDDSATKISELNISLGELKETLSSAQTELDNNEQALISAEQEYETQKAEYTATLEASKEQLEQAEIELESGKSELENSKAEFEKAKSEGKEKLDSGRKEYEEAKADADKEFEKAEKELNDAQKKLDDFSSPKWYIFNRDDNPSYSSFIDDANRVDAVATVFPLFFLLVAMLVTLTTMTRLIEEKRTEIGTFKALGYSNARIVGKFLTYSTFAAVFGSVFGCLLGIPILPKVIYNAYKMMYYMQDIRIKISWPVLIIGVVCAIVCCTFVTAFVCFKSLREKPSELMRPKVPKIGKRIILEKIPFIWNRLSFTSKVTQRNLFRYKSRFFMTAIGIAGCTALIVAGFGIKDAITDIVDIQFGEINKYDIMIVSEGDEKGDFSPLMSTLDKDDRIKDKMLYMQKNITVSSEKAKMTDDVFLCVPDDEKNMDELVSLREREIHKKLYVEDGCAIVSEKLAKILSVKVGDSITLDGTNDKKITVGGICENYIYGYIYITKNTYKDLFEKDVEYNMVLVNVHNLTQDDENNIGFDYLQRDDVKALSFMSTGVKDFQDMIQSMNLIVLVLIVCAGALAIVVLYNLTNINLAERSREIATIKVLGFNHRETASFVYRENIILTVIGTLLGLVLGVWLSRFIVVTVEIDKVMFGRTMHFMSFVYATIGTFLFSAFVNFIMYFRMKKIDMVESLKSVE